MPSELKPCPFCGQDAKIAPDEIGSGGQHVPPYHAGCFLGTGCGIVFTDDDPDEAIAAWNRRVSSVAERAEGEAVAWRWREHYNAARDDRWHLEKELPQFSYDVEIQPLFAHPSPATVGVKESPMQFFSENVDRWGAAEWFDRLAKATREQDRVVLLLHNASTNGKDTIELEGELETYRNIAASSAMRLVREFEQQVRSALIPSPSAPAVGEDREWCKLYHSRWPTEDLLKAREPGGLVTDDGEAWKYHYTHSDAQGGAYDLVYRPRPPAATVPSVGEITEDAISKIADAVFIDGWGTEDANRLRTALTAALSGCRVAEWRPIETAPTNKAILVHLPNTDYCGNDGVYAAVLVDMGTGKRWMTFGWAIGRDCGPDNEPDGWMSMPPAPALPASPKEGE